uniref:LolA-like domain-containing protein n=1 Tax=Ixodes ricinus TaxID=34613 RepID=A0A147BFE0_IXORI
MIMRMRGVACVLLYIATIRTNALIHDFDEGCEKFGVRFPAWIKPRSGWLSMFNSRPSLGHSYILKYEYQEISASQPAWVEEYFDKKKQRAKIIAVSLGVEFADIYDYESQRVMSYKARKPSTSGSDVKTQVECGIYDLKTFKSKYLHLRFPCATKSSTTCDMPTANEVVRYGPPYSYKLKNELTASETRNIKHKLYTACIKDPFMNGTYESYYYWGEDLSFRFPSGEKNMPVHVEQKGEYYENKTMREHHIFKNIPWYQKDPPFSDDMFQVPHSMYCKNYTNLHAIPAMPNSFSFSQEELAFTLNASGFLKGGFSPLSFKQFWYSDNLTLVRVDMRPSEADKKGPILKEVTGINGRVSVVMDFNYDYAFLAHSANDECRILKVDKDFFLCYKEDENCSKINREALFGISADLSYKGKYAEIGIYGETWSKVTEEMKNGTPATKVLTRHEVSFQDTEVKEKTSSHKKVFTPIQVADYKEEITTPESTDDSNFKQDVRLKNYYEVNFSQPGLEVYEKHPCLQRHNSTLYTLAFEGPGVVDSNKARFLPQLRRALKRVCNPETMLRFELVDLRSPKNISEKIVYLRILQPFDSNGTSTDVLVSKITDIVNKEEFAVCFEGFTITLNEKLMQLIAINGTFAEHNLETTASNNTSSASQNNNKIQKCSA